MMTDVDPARTFYAALLAYRDEHRATKHPVRLNPSTVRTGLEDEGEAVGITDPEAWVAAGLDRIVAELAATPEGGRNDALHRAAFVIGRWVGGELPVDVDEVENQLYSAMTLNGYEATHGDTIACVRRSMTKGANVAPFAWVKVDPAPVELVRPYRPLPSLDVPSREASGVDAWHADRVAQEIAAQRARRHAARYLDAEDVATMVKDWPEDPLAAFLAEPDTATVWLVEKVFPHGANVTVTAPYKTGKTTLVNNLVRALADGGLFLDRYPVEPGQGRVVVCNYEVGRDQYRRWLRDAGVENADRVTVLNLRGLAAPVTVPQIADRYVEVLARNECGVWILDPFARAFTGSGDENDNGDVSRFLDTLDKIKERAGVHSLVMPVHTGRAVAELGAERARGATRLDDWPDVRWLLARGADENEDVRYFRATGRDVDTEEEALSYDDTTRRLHLGGHGRVGAKARAEADRVLAAITETPGISTVALKAATGLGHAKITAKLAALVGANVIHERPGDKPNGHYWHPGAPRYELPEDRADLS
jgi:AAA domain